MTPQTTSKTEALEEEIEELQRQKALLQSQYDFADFIETHQLVDQEIERLQKLLLEEEKSELIMDSMLFDFEAEAIEEEEEEEEEEYLPLHSKYNIEQVIKGSDGLLSPVKPSDLDIDSNNAVRSAFKTIYEWQRQKEKYSDKASDDKDADYKPRPCRVYQKRSTA